MITLEQYCNHDPEFRNEATQEILENAQKTVDCVNLLLERASAGVSCVLVSGGRSRSRNEVLSGASTTSKHLTGQAADIGDNDRRLSDWCIDNAIELGEIGVWLEHPAWCYKKNQTTGIVSKWLHIQIVPPLSRRRIYRPNMKPPLDEEYFDEVGDLSWVK